MTRYLLLAVLALALAACGGSDAPPAADAPADQPAAATDVPAEPTTAPEPTAEPASEAGTRDNPIPLGQPAEVNDWTVTVLSVNENAADLVAAENEFNDPPIEGHQFVMVRVAVTHNGEEPASFWLDTSQGIVGSGGNSFTDRCGVIPEDLTDEGEMFQGATAEGNLCFSVEAAQLEGATLSVEESIALDSGRVFFALK